LTAQTFKPGQKKMAKLTELAELNFGFLNSVNFVNPVFPLLRFSAVFRAKNLFTRANKLAFSRPFPENPSISFGNNVRVTFLQNFLDTYNG
jgi:hypothetical protein